MYREYPEYFERILYICHKNDICQQITLNGIANSEYEKRAAEYATISDEDLLNSKVSISPDVSFIDYNKPLAQSDTGELKLGTHLKTYDAYLSQNIVIKYDTVMTNLLKMLKSPIRLDKITIDLDRHQLQSLIKIIRKGLFDNVLII